MARKKRAESEKVLSMASLDARNAATRDTTDRELRTDCGHLGAGPQSRQGPIGCDGMINDGCCLAATGNGWTVAGVPSDESAIQHQANAEPGF